MGAAAFVGLWSASLYEIRAVVGAVLVIGLLHAVLWSLDSTHSRARNLGWNKDEWVEFDNPRGGDGWADATD